MNSSTRKILIGFVIGIIVFLLGYLAWQERATSNVPTSSTTTTSTSTIGSVTISPTSTTQVGGYTIKPITGPVAPNYKTSLSYPANMDATTQAQDQTQFAAVQAALGGDSTNYEAWIALGALREGTGDYAGAATDWKYVTEIYPADPTAYANLGDLYANYLHQSAQGIAYYKLAIKADPTTEETLYDNLAQVYLAEGDKADAKATLQQGITAQVIGYQNLQNELNSIQ